jgi:hypothetical protein
LIWNFCSTSSCSGGVALALTQPFGEPHKREREREREIEGRGEAHGGERRALLKELPQSTCVKLSSKGSLYIGGGRRHPPFN